MYVINCILLINFQFLFLRRNHQWICGTQAWDFLLLTKAVFGSCFSIKWNNGTLHEEYWQQLPNIKTDTERERGGSPGLEKYPHAFPAVFPIKSVFVFTTLINIFDKTQVRWLRAWGAECRTHQETSDAGFQNPKQINNGSVPPQPFESTDIQATHHFWTVKVDQCLQRKLG